MLLFFFVLSTCSPLSLLSPCVCLIPQGGGRKKGEEEKAEKGSSEECRLFPLLHPHQASYFQLISHCSKTTAQRRTRRRLLLRLPAPPAASSSPACPPPRPSSACPWLGLRPSPDLLPSNSVRFWTCKLLHGGGERREVERVPVGGSYFLCLERLYKLYYSSQNTYDQ